MLPTNDIKTTPKKKQSRKKKNFFLALTLIKVKSEQKQKFP